MEELRQSIKKREDIKINKKKDLLLQKLPYGPDDNLSFEFIDKIPQESVIWAVLIQICQNNLRDFNLGLEDIMEKKIYQTVNYQELVDACLPIIVTQHLDIADYQFNQRIVKDTIQQFTEQISILETYKQIQFNQSNKLQISYSKHRSLRTELFNYYKIKYKVAMNNQEQKSIYPIGEEDLICSFPILPDSNQLVFQIIGKPIQGGGQYEQIAEIPLDLDEILISFPLKTYSKEIIQPCQLKLDYRDERYDSPYQGVNVMELKFQLQMPSEQRIELMRKLLEKQQHNLDIITKIIENKDQLIKSLLVIYPDIEYVTGVDIKDKKELNSRACECNIF